MNNNFKLKRKIYEIAIALENASANVKNMCSGNASRDAALYKSMLFKIKDEMIPETMKLCEDNNKIKEKLDKLDRDIWTMDYTFLSRMENNSNPESINHLSEWIKQCANNLVNG